MSKLDGLGHDNLVVLIFGSQTGTAEDLALRTQKDISTKLNIPSIVIDPEEYDMDGLEKFKDLDSNRNWVVGFFMATYGEGEPTDNATELYSWLMDGQGLGPDKGEEDDQMVEDQVCEKMNYFMFGLGNKTYEYYNAISRRMDKRLTKLGARRIGDLGEGDDDGR
jgi:NADPH-ferrihemoprotein reductase